MGKINCRGHENRRNLVSEYRIVPELRVKMIKGIIVSDAGGRVTDELYVFSVYKKADGTFYDKILCGEHSAKDFLSLTGEKRPPIFNILKSPRSTNSNRSTGVFPSVAEPNSVTYKNTITWHPVNKVLYDAVMIMLLVWNDTSGNSILFREMHKCLKYPDKYPYSDRLRRVNSIISKDKRGTLANILKDLENAGNELREFDLKTLHEAVEKTGVKSYIL